MQIRPILPNEVKAARRLLVAASWDRKISNADELAELVARSQRALVAMERLGVKPAA